MKIFRRLFFLAVIFAIAVLFNMFYMSSHGMPSPQDYQQTAQKYLSDTMQKLQD